jgi:Na+-driven multidrug efflux pump
VVEPAPAAVAPYAVPVAPTPIAPTPGLAGDDSALDGEPAPPLTLRDRLRRLSPVFVTMIVGSIGSTVFLALAVTSHTTPVAVLVGAAVVTTLVFALDAAMCTAVTYQAGQDQEAGRALLFAVLGGVSAVICALAMAGTLIMILVLNS